MSTFGSGVLIGDAHLTVDAKEECGKPDPHV